MKNIIRDRKFDFCSSLVAVGISLMFVPTLAQADDMMGSMPATQVQKKPMQNNSTDATDMTSDHDQMKEDHEQMVMDHKQMMKGHEQMMKDHEQMMKKNRKGGMNKGQQKMNSMKKKSMPMDKPGMMGDGSMKPDMPKDPHAGMGDM